MNAKSHDETIVEMFIQNLWKWALGYPERNITRKMPLEEVVRTQRCKEFERLRMNRKVVGGYRYGFMDDPGQDKYDRIGALENCVQKFKETRDADYLADAANYCELIFAVGDFKTLTANDDVEHCGFK